VEVGDDPHYRRHVFLQTALAANDILFIKNCGGSVLRLEVTACDRNGADIRESILW
jgi:hypothetical protein